jgi:predicted lactoylglutathione lyase
LLLITLIGIKVKPAPANGPEYMLKEEIAMIQTQTGSQSAETQVATQAPKLMFVNLPVKDLARAVAFYEAVGAVKNTQFTDETAACMVLSETIHVMLLTHDKFKFFCKKDIFDAKTGVEVLLCVSENSRDGVDAMVDKAWSAGGTLDPTPKQDFGFMYSRSYEDPDGHIWEIMWMDLAAAQASMDACPMSDEGQAANAARNGAQTAAA